MIPMKSKIIPLFLIMFLAFTFFIPLILSQESIHLIQPTSFTDSLSVWSNEADAYDWNNATNADGPPNVDDGDIYWDSWNNTNLGSITQVDLRIRIDLTGLSDDTVTVAWYVGGTQGSGTYEINSGNEGNDLVFSFDDVTEPNDSSWSWVDIGNLQIRQLGAKEKGPDTVSYYTDEVWGWVTVEAVANNPPTNDKCEITDLDDTDDLYAQKQLYTIDYDVNDPDGFADLDYAEVRFKQGASTRAIFRYDEDTDTFSVESGSSEWTLDGTSSANEASTYINITMKVAAQWDATEEADLEIECYVVDDEPESDTDTMQSDYFDVITNLVTNSIECTDSNGPDRVDVSSSIQIDFSVRYSDEPLSGTPSSYYPPDAEFTSISVYDTGDNNKGTDSSIVNGAGSVSFNAESSVTNMNYNLYIDMSDADYSDGEESTTETVISDQIEIVSVAFDDSRVNINTAAEVRYVLQYDYDDASFEGGDGSIVGFTWDAINSWWDKSVISPSSPSAETYDENDLGALTDSNYGLTVYEDDAGSNLIGDRIIILTLTTNNSSPSVDEYVELRVTAELEYDNHPIDDGTNDALNLVDATSPSMTWDGVDSRWEVEDTRSSPEVVTFDEVTGSEDTYGITAINMDGKSVIVTWGEVAGYYYLTVYFEDGLIFNVNGSSLVNGSENQYDQNIVLNCSGEAENANWEFLGFERVTYNNFTVDTPMYIDLIANETIWAYSQIEGEPLLYESVWIFSLIWVCLVGFSLFKPNLLLKGGAVMVGFILALTIYTNVTGLGGLFGWVVVLINCGLLVSVLFEK